MADDIVFVSRSLCFGSKITKKYVKDSLYYNILVTTTPSSPQIIPCKIKRKQSVDAYTKNKNPLHKSFNIEKLNVDNYYGFNLSGNNLYCLDNFIITHNTGKSLFMCHVASSVLLQGKNVLYITLEMAEERIAERIDANLLNVPIQDIVNLPKQMFESKVTNLAKKTQGTLIIKEYPTASAHAGHFKSLLNELSLKKSFKPDIIFIDYLNICASSRYKGNSSINSYTFVKAIAEELRGLAVEFNVPIFSATQTTRSGFGSSDPELTDTSECIFVDEMLEMRDGTSKKISEVVVGDQIKSQDDYKTVMVVHHKKEKECIKISTKSGKSIIVSKDHVFPTNNGRKSFNSGLCVGDYLNSSH